MLNFLNNNGGGTFILFDIGGTKIRAAVSRGGKNIGDIKTAETPKDFNEALKLLGKMKEELLGKERANVVVLGIPGILSKDKKKIFKTPNLPGWDGMDFSAELEKIFNVPVFIENDCVLVGLGEAVSGAGAGSKIVAYITVSTGVGGARIVNGKVDQKTFGFEPGWQIINSADLLKGDDRAYLGHCISGRALEERFGRKAKDIVDETIHEDLSFNLACGLYNTILHWSPDTVVLGGSMITGVNPIPLDKVEGKLKELLTVFPEIPQIRKATLGDAGGLYGALEYARQKFN